MKQLSVTYLSSLQVYDDDEAERPYLSDAGLERYKQEYSAQIRARVMALAKPAS